MMSAQCVHRQVAVAAWALVVPLASACAGAEASGPAVVVRDSAGVTVVESRRPAWGAGEAWLLSPRPLLVLGGQEEAGHDLYRVRGALWLGDGRIVVADAGSAELRFFDTAGRLVRVAGGRGGGPGEYRFLSFMARLRGDSLLVWDSRARRVTVTDLEGVPVRTATLANPRYQARLALADGTLLASDVRRASPPVEVELLVDAVVRPTRAYANYAADGALVAELGEWPDNEQWSSFDVDHGHVQDLLFGKRTVLAAGNDRFWV
ncbi:MAG TPA: 6-bladed beta-propeller, partial [Longimicrobiales bacterium]|nr:6-bladed beta-propeller [Longimicrobiales bacterium]